MTVIRRLRAMSLLPLILLLPAAVQAGAAVPPSAGVAEARTALRDSDACVERGNRGTARASRCYALDYGGYTRTLRVYVPHQRGGPWPLLVVLHGGGGGGGGMEGLTRSGFDRIADRDGLVVVYPDGIGHGWNDGRTDLKSEAVKRGVDDLGYLRALPGLLAQRFPIDPARVYATGISNGGLMSYRLACDAADVYAAVAPVAANLSVELAPACRPPRPVPVLIIDGTDDPIMPWDGGAVRVLWMTRGDVLSAPATFARWRALDGCGPARADAEVDAVPDDQTSFIVHRASCAGSEVTLYEVRGGGHTWPQGVPYLGPRIVGRVSAEFDANQVVWDFLRRYRLPR